MTIGQGVFQCLADNCLFQNVLGAGCARRRLFVRERTRSYERKVCQAHVFHCTGDRPDVSRVCRADKYDAYRH